MRDRNSSLLGTNIYRYTYCHIAEVDIQEDEEYMSDDDV